MTDVQMIVLLVGFIAAWCLICARVFSIVPTRETAISSYKALLHKIQNLSTVQYMPDVEDQVEEFFHDYHDELYYNHLCESLEHRRHELQGSKILKNIV